ncbi:GntR family transcriptional regulator [Streptosporangium sp. CA-115845]|uniref:GntR family transcriptional regulator n=1 Tax=Streptosporangium sp. CA-115845 TaxID=3240071 RepID=UPI003D9144BD
MAALHPFRRIADDLREEILDGRLAPGARLPSENELAVRYATTRTTVRKAIALLRGEGYIASAQGSGSYVRSRPALLMISTGSQWRSRRDGGISPLSAEFTEQGHEVEQRLLSVGEEPAPRDVAELLGLAAGDAVIVRRRRVLIGGSPMQLGSAYYPTAIFGGTAAAESRRIKGGVLGMFEDALAGRIARFVERLSIRMPTPVEASELQLPSGVPIARTVRVAYDARGRSVEVLVSIVPGDAYTFEYVIDVPPPAAD